jgi:hypothetical protein
MNEETAAKVREIRGQMEKLAPYQASGQVTAKGVARYLAMETQVAWSRAMNGTASPSVTDIAIITGQFAAVHALLALAEADPKAADETAAEIRDAWEDGGGVGEWTWEHLGPDAKEIARLAGELATVIAPGQVTVRRDDLLAVLAEAEGFIGSKDNAAFTRLAAEVGVQ